MWHWIIAAIAIVVIGILIWALAEIDKDDNWPSQWPTGWNDEDEE